MIGDSLVASSEDSARSSLATALRPVQIRLRMQSGLNGLTTGLLFAGIVVCLLGLSRFLLPQRISIWRTSGLILGFAPILGGLIGCCRRPSLHAVASAVDRECGLKNRMAGAVCFADRLPQSPLERLQITDAREQLTRVPLANVAALRPPAHMPVAAGAFLFAILCIGVSSVRDAPKTSPVPSVSLITAAEMIDAQLSQLETLVAVADLPELAALPVQLRTQLTELRQSQGTPRQTLAAISEMQRTLHSQHAQFNAARTNDFLRDLGAAISNWPDLAAAGEALRAARFDTAADELDRSAQKPAGNSSLPEDDAARAAAQLAELAEAMQQAGQSELAASAAQFAQEAAAGSTPDAAERKTLASAVRRHDRVQKVAKLLQQYEDQLGEAKSMAADDASRRGDSAQQVAERDQGAADGARRAATAADASASGSGSGGRNAGATPVGNIDGDKTLLESQRQIAKLTGQLSVEGESQSRKVQSPGQNADVRRQTQDVFAEYERRSEATIQSEAIPTVHRETIRRYFELLRPAVTAGSSKSPP